MNEKEKTLFELVNPPFSISFAGKEYLVRKANLEKAVRYQTRLNELVKASDPAIDIKIAAYCLFMVLNDVDSSISEDFVFQNAPANFNPIEWIETLGFMTPQKKMEALEKKVTA